MRQPINQSGLPMASFFFPQKYILGEAACLVIFCFAGENCPAGLFLKAMWADFLFYIG